MDLTTHTPSLHTTSRTYWRAALWEHASTIATQSCTVHHVVDGQPATFAELVGSCGAAATETNSRGAPSAVTSLAARQTSGDLQAGRSYVQRATHDDTGVLEQSSLTMSLHASKMSFRSLTRSLMAVPRTNTVCESRSFSVCASVYGSLPPDIQDVAV